MVVLERWASRSSMAPTEIAAPTTDTGIFAPIAYHSCCRQVVQGEQLSSNRQWSHVLLAPAWGLAISNNHSTTNQSASHVSSSECRNRQPSSIVRTAAAAEPFGSATAAVWTALLTEVEEWWIQDSGGRSRDDCKEEEKARPAETALGVAVMDGCCSGRPSHGGRAAAETRLQLLVRRLSCSRRLEGAKAILHPLVVDVAEEGGSELEESGVASRCGLGQVGGWEGDAEDEGQGQLGSWVADGGSVVRSQLWRAWSRGAGSRTGCAGRSR